MAEIFSSENGNLRIDKEVVTTESKTIPYNFLLEQRESAYQEFLRAQENLARHDQLISEAKKLNLDKPVVAPVDIVPINEEIIP